PLLPYATRRVEAEVERADDGSDVSDEVSGSPRLPVEAVSRSAGCVPDPGQVVAKGGLSDRRICYCRFGTHQVCRFADHRAIAAKPIGAHTRNLLLELVHLVRRPLQ